MSAGTRVWCFFLFDECSILRARRLFGPCFSAYAGRVFRYTVCSVPVLPPLTIRIQSLLLVHPSSEEQDTSTVHLISSRSSQATQKSYLSQVPLSARRCLQKPTSQALLHRQKPRRGMETPSLCPRKAWRHVQGLAYPTESFPPLLPQPLTAGTLCQNLLRLPRTLGSTFKWLVVQCSSPVAHLLS